MLTLYDLHLSDVGFACALESPTIQEVENDACFNVKSVLMQ